jgi:hypothetical protein
MRAAHGWGIACSGARSPSPFAPLVVIPEGDLLFAFALAFALAFAPLSVIPAADLLSPMPFLPSS